MELRRFRTRNGSIIEEKPGEFSIIRNGYIDEYTIVKCKRDKKKNYVEGSWICLSFPEKGKPTGGAHGKGWDIIEEIK